MTIKVFLLNLGWDASIAGFHLPFDLKIPIGGTVASWLVCLFWSEQSGNEPWVGTLCCVLGQDTLLDHSTCLSSQEMGTGSFNAGKNPAMD